MFINRILGFVLLNYDVDLIDKDDDLDDYFGWEIVSYCLVKFFIWGVN